MAASGHPSGILRREPAPDGNTDRLWLAGGAVLAVGAIAAYSRTLSVPFLFDDNAAVVDNLTIRHWNTAFWPPTDTTASGRPVLNLSLAFNYAISGTAVWSYHVLNLLIHVLAGLTLFGVVRRTLAPRTGEASFIAFSAALLWTLHPLQTESVTYIVQRAESLMGLFYLLTLYCFIRGAGVEGCRQRNWFFLSVAACLLGVATKEVMVTGPLIVLLYDRTFVSGSWRNALRRHRWVHLGLAATWLPLAGLVASTGWDRHGTAGFGCGGSPGAYWLTQFEAGARYLWLSVWPHPLVFEYGTFRVASLEQAAPYALLAAMLTTAVLVALWRRPALGFPGACFFVILAPTSIVPGRVQMIVEHRMYLPLAAVTTFAAIGIHATAKRHTWALLVLLALGLGCVTAQRNEDYRSGLAIWGDTIARRPNSALAHANLGVALSKVSGRLDDAIAQYKEALRLNPDFPEAHYDLANAWAGMPGRLNEAIAEYEEALRLRPDYAEAHENLAFALEGVPGRLDDAVAQYKEALRLNPGSAEARNNLGNDRARMPGRLDDAIVQYKEALRVEPELAEAHNDLGLALEQIPGRLNDAIAEYEEALRLNPGLTQARSNLGNALARMPGRLNDAIAQYEEVLRLKPDHVWAHYNLGLALARTPGRLEDAITQYREALRLDPNLADAHTNLGVALSQIPGRLSEAVVEYQETLRLNPDSAEARYDLGVAFSAMPGRLNDAIVQYREALRLRPGFASAWHNLGACWFQLGNLPEAIAAFREELRLSPDDPGARQSLAAALKQSEKR